VRGHDIVVIGTSAGGVGALQEIIRNLPTPFPASLFVVLHLKPHLPSSLPRVLLNAGRLPVEAVTRPIRFRAGHIYVAIPNRHLTLDRTWVMTGQGPPEHRHRPSVDVLFRSAAANHGRHVIGVVLTGVLRDGAAGLAAIAAGGGITMVQDPEDALFPDMPAHALKTVPVDYVLPLAEIAPALARLIRKSTRPRPHRRVSKRAPRARGTSSPRSPSSAPPGTAD
jgi:two-component system chemotaxis response regulator CheB